VDGPEQFAIRRVRLFSRFGRRICGLAMVVIGLATLWMLVAIICGFRDVTVNFGPYSVEAANLATPFLKTWGILFVGAVFTLMFLWVIHLRALFGDLAGGSIYTARNVRRIRQIGLLMLSMPPLVGALGLVSVVVLKAGVINEASVTRHTWGITLGALCAFLAPGVILLASWIMEIGRKTQDEADEMRRDAELVV
jgi:hypothetical protein